jgi:hypothetical protein
MLGERGELVKNEASSTGLFFGAGGAAAADAVAR